MRPVMRSAIRYWMPLAFTALAFGFIWFLASLTDPSWTTPGLASMVTGSSVGALAAIGLGHLRHDVAIAGSGISDRGLQKRLQRAVFEYLALFFSVWFLAISSLSSGDLFITWMVLGPIALLAVSLLLEIRAWHQGSENERQRRKWITGLMLATLLTMALHFRGPPSIAELFRM